MRLFLLLAVIALGACGHRSDDATTPAGSSAPKVPALPEEPKAAPRPAPAEAPKEAPKEAPNPAPKPAMPDEVTSFITPEVIGITKATGRHNPIVANLSLLFSFPPDCYNKLTGKIRAAYSLEQGAAQGEYYIFEGAPSRDEAEACITLWLGEMLQVTIEHDGELSVFRMGSDGAVYAAWRGPLAIIGSKEQVTRVLHAGTPEVATTWRTRFSQLPSKAEMAEWSASALFKDLSGVATTSYVVAIDRIEQVPPMPRWTGRVIAQYASANDAAAAAKRIRQSQPKPADPALPSLPDAFKGKKVTQTGATVEIGFTLEMSQRFTLSVLGAWLRMLADARPPGEH